MSGEFSMSLLSKLIDIVKTRFVNWFISVLIVF